MLFGSLFPNVPLVRLFCLKLNSFTDFVHISFTLLAEAVDAQLFTAEHVEQCEPEAPPEDRREFKAEEPFLKCKVVSLLFTVEVMKYLND